MKTIMQKRIKSKIYALFFWQTNFGELLNKIYDLILFYSYSFKNKGLSDVENLRACLIKEYHIVEKGMALPNPRAGFGNAKILALIPKTELYVERSGCEDTLVQSIKESMVEYLSLNQERGEDMTTPYYQTIRQFVSGSKMGILGGTKVMKKIEIEKSICIDYERFVSQRVSVRDFSSEAVKKEELSKAINIAKNAPSVCNRQAWKAHVFLNDIDIAKLLTYQHGNAGFGETLKALIVVTTDIKSFTNLESNQVFIDGGIFSMSLILALHSVGLGSCAMNTCIPYVDEKKIKLIGEIPSNERLIMMLGVGQLKEEFKVPISYKKDDSQIVSFHQETH